MVTLLRSNQRRHERRGKQDTWHSFSAPLDASPITEGFGVLVAFDEIRFPPGESTKPHCDDEMEAVLYVFRGALSQENTAESSVVILAGEFQHMTTGHRVRQKETSVSRREWVHLFRISLRPSIAGLDRHHEQRRFTAAQRRNLMCVVASPDGRKGSLRIQQDALVYSIILEPGHHIVHTLAPGRTVWLHVVYGKAALGDLILTSGDSVGVTGGPSVSLTVQENAELLLVDLGGRARPGERRGHPLYTRSRE